MNKRRRCEIDHMSPQHPVLLKVDESDGRAQLMSCWWGCCDRTYIASQSNLISMF